MAKGGTLPVRSASGDDALPSFDALLHARLDTLQPAARRVIRHIAQHRLAFLSASAAELARQTGASDATVVRAVKALGFKGLAELRAAVAATLADDTSLAGNLRRTVVDVGEDVDGVVAAIIDTHRDSLREIGRPESQALLVRAIRTLSPCERLLIFGIGPSAALADYVAMLLRRHGRSARALTATGNGLTDQILDLAPGDGMMLLAYSRTYPELLLLFDEAERLRLPVVLMTDSLDPRLARRADAVVPARRGRQGRVAMHAATLVLLEAIALGLAIAGKDRAMASLSRVGELRGRLAGLQTDVAALDG